MSEKSNVIPDVIKLSKVANVKEMKQELKIDLQKI